MADACFPLNTAILTATDTVVEILLKEGAPPNRCREYMSKITPMHNAAKIGAYRSLELLLKYGGMRKIQMFAVSVLFEHVFEGNSECEDSSQRTPLDYAMRHLNFSCVVILLSYGAKVSTYEISKDWNLSKEEEIIFERMSDIIDNGFIWPNWNIRNCFIFPSYVRKSVFLTLCLSKKKETLFFMLPKDVILLLISFVATPSKGKILSLKFCSNYMIDNVYI